MGCDFFSETSVEGKPTEFIVSLPKMPFTFMLLENKFLDPPSIRSALTDQGSVAYLLTRLGQFYEPVVATVATGIDLNAMPDPCSGLEASETITLGGRGIISTDIPQMTSKFAEIVPRPHLQVNSVPIAAIR